MTFLASSATMSSFFLETGAKVFPRHPTLPKHRLCGPVTNGIHVGQEDDLFKLPGTPAPNNDSIIPSSIRTSVPCSLLAGEGRGPHELHDFVGATLPFRAQREWPRRSLRHCPVTFQLGPAHVEDPVAILTDELHRLTLISISALGLIRLALSHIRRAYFYAKPADDIHIELPDYYDAGTWARKCGKLKRCLYRTRQAARTWQRELDAGVMEADLKIGEMSKCTFRSGCGKLVGTLHGDLMSGPRIIVEKVPKS